MATAMATLPVDRLSILLGSDNCVDNLCAVCLKQGRHVTAIRYCDGCADNMCSTCLEWHDKFPATKNHRQTGIMARSKTLPKKFHHGQNSDSQINRSRPHSDNPRFRDVPPPLPYRPSNKYKDMIQKFENIQETKRERIIQINTEENKNISAIQNIRDTVIKHIDQLGMASIDTVRQTYADEREKEFQDLEYLDKHVKLMKAEKDVNIEKERDALNKLTGYERKRLKFVPIVEIENIYKKTAGVGVLTTGERSHRVCVQRKESYKVSLDSDTSKCVLYASCLLADGSVVLTDNANKRLKVLQRKANSFEYIDLPSGPWGVCSTNLYEVAVTLTNDKTVQFVSIGKSISMTRSFKVEEHCRGICQGKSELYVACGSANYAGTGFIGVYDMEGQPLRKIKTDTTGQQIFSLPYHVARQPGDNRLCIADKNRGVILVSDQGILNTPCLDLVKTTYLCVLDNGEILACGLNSDTIVHFDRNGNKISTLLGKEDDLDGPFSILFDHADSSLIITSYKGGVIDVFTLKF